MRKLRCKQARRAIASGGLVVPRRRAVETRRQDKSDVTAVGYASRCLTKKLHQSDEGNQCDRGPCHFGHQSSVGDEVWSNLRPTAPAPLLVGSHSHQKLGPSGARTTSREQRGTSQVTYLSTVVSANRRLPEMLHHFLVGPRCSSTYMVFMFSDK